MRRLRNSLALFVIVMGIFLNIERLDIGGQLDVIDIQTFVYLLVGGAVLVTLWLPEFWRPSDSVWVAIWMGVYLILKIGVFRSRPFGGGIYTYLTITELSMLAVVILSAYRVAKDIFDYEETVATVTLGDVSERVKKLSQAGEEISKEFARSRRHDSPLSVIVLKINEEDLEFNLHRTAEEILRGMMKRYTSNKLIRKLDQSLRRSDLVIEQPEDGTIVVLLPETSKDGSAVLAERIQNAAHEELGIEVACGFASFPRDALTFEELVNQATVNFRTPTMGPGIEARVGKSS